MEVKAVLSIAYSNQKLGKKKFLTRSSIRVSIKI
jgi:hypothetical protein